MSRSYSSIKDKKRNLNDSSLSMSKPVKKKQIYNHFITLSQALVEHTQSFDENKISVVQKFVNEIDLLPKKFHKIETLYLSSNNIRTLEGLQQFSSLKNLSLANNEIDDAGSLNILELLPSIEVLTLSGNPICRLPNYRPLVISLLPCLRSFDGKPVTSEEKHKSEVNLRTQSGLLNLLLSNYCELIKMNNFQRRLEIHKELLARHPQFAKNYVHINVGKWKQMFDYENQLDKNFKNALKSNLLQDVSTIKHELNLKEEENEVAFSELILRQQQKIGELVYRAEETVKQMGAHYSRNLASRRSLDVRATPLDLKSPNSNLKNSKLGSPYTSTRSRTNKQVTISEKNNTFSEEPKVLRTNQNKSFKSPDATERDLLQKLGQSASSSGRILNDFAFTPTPLSNTNKIQIHTPQSNLRYRDTFSVPNSTKNSTFMRSERPQTPTLQQSPMKMGIPQPSRLNTSPHKDECCRSICRSTNGFDFEGRKSPENPRYKSPFKKRIEEKERLIENLAQDLRNKTQELIKFEGYTRQLTEKLQAYQGQNTDNIKIAEEEIENLSKELERSVTIQYELENAVNSLKSELGDLYRKNHDLEIQSQRLHEVETKANAYARELEARVIEENMNLNADFFRDKKLKIRALKQLKRSVIIQQELRGFLEYYRSQKIKKNLVNCFNHLARLASITRFTKQKNQQRQAKAQRKLFNVWKGKTAFGLQVKEFVMEMNERRLKRGVVAWKQYIFNVSKKRIQYKKLENYYLNKTKKRAFNIFVELRRRMQYEPNEEKALTKKAQKYNVFTIKKQLFARWLNWAQTAKPVRLNKEKAQAFAKKHLLDLGFRGLIQVKEHNKKNLERAQRRINRKNRDITAKYLKFWKHFLKVVVPARKKQEEKKETFIKKRLLNTWKTQFQLRQQIKISSEQALQLYNKNLSKKIFKHLAKLRIKRKQLHYFKNVIATKHENLTQSKYFSGWNKLFKHNEEARRQAREERREGLYTYFQAWKKFRNACIIQKIKDHNLEKHLARAERNKVTSVLFGWFNYTRLKKRNREVLELMAAKKKFSLYKAVLFELMKNSRTSLKQNMARILAKSALLEADARDNQKYVNDVDAEKVEIRDKAHLYQEEVVKLNIQVEERDREIHNMRRVIQQSEKNEKSLLEEITIKNSIVKELESKLHRNGSESQYVYSEYDKEIELLKEERATLMRRVGALENEVDFKQKSLFETEKTLLDKSNQAEGIIKDVEKKFANSVKMASEFRNVIEVKDDQVTSLVAQLQKALEEKQEAQNKLREAFHTINESREFYEGRLKFLERQNLEIISNIEYYKDDVAKQQRFITDLKADLRKSQHRLEIISDKAHLDDQEFIKSIRREASPSYNRSQRLASPVRLRSPKLDKYRRDYSAEKREARERKQEIDNKITILENYMVNSSGTPVSQAPLKSALKNPLNKLLHTQSPPEPRINNTMSVRSLRTASTHMHDSDYDLSASVKELPRNAPFFKTNDPASSVGSDKSPVRDTRLSVKNLQSKERSPLSSRSPLRSAYLSQSKGASTLNDAEYEKMKKDRVQRRKGLERRLEDLTQSLKSDLEKARTRTLV